MRSTAAKTIDSEEKDAAPANFSATEHSERTARGACEMVQQSNVRQVILNRKEGCNGTRSRRSDISGRSSALLPALPCQGFRSAANRRFLIGHDKVSRRKSTIANSAMRKVKPMK